MWWCLVDGWWVIGFGLLLVTLKIDLISVLGCCLYCIWVVWVCDLGLLPIALIWFSVGFPVWCWYASSRRFVVIRLALR